MGGIITFEVEYFDHMGVAVHAVDQSLTNDHLNVHSVLLCYCTHVNSRPVKLKQCVLKCYDDP